MKDEKLKNYPEGLAMLHFAHGGGQSDNPYQYGTDQHRRYAMEMSRMWDQQYRTEQASARAGK
jgi:hypothetical protein